MLSREQKIEFCKKVAALTKEQREAFAERIVLPVTTEGHQISVLNTIILAYQGLENPTVIGGFNQWRDKGRTVKEKQKAYYIRRPIVREDPDKKEGEISSKDDRFFIFYAVFDITQTEEYDATAKPQRQAELGARIITAKFRSCCTSCERTIQKGDQIEYFRLEKTVKCMECSSLKNIEDGLKKIEDNQADDHLMSQYDDRNFYDANEADELRHEGD